MRVNIDLIARELERHLGAIGHAERRFEALRAKGPDADARGDIFARQRPIALHPDPDRARERTERQQEQPEQRPQGESQRPYSHQCPQAGDDETGAQQSEQETSQDEGRGAEGGYHVKQSTPAGARGDLTPTRANVEVRIY